MSTNQKFGSGYIIPDVYNTAWVARIPDPSDPKKPAFPQSLEWVRDQQLSDGSWGADKPVFPFDRIISTLIAIICLKQWKNSCDLKAIKRGIEALNRFWDDLKITDNMTIGFEILLPSLIDEAINYGIQFNEPIIEILRKEKLMKIESIMRFEKNGKGFDGPKPWWHSIEGVGGMLNDDNIISRVGKDGIINDSYSATAFALMKYQNLSESYENIKNVVNENDGGVPAFTPIIAFEFAWSIGFLYQAEYILQNYSETITTTLNKLDCLFEERNGMFGGCIYGSPDADTISNTLYAFNACNKPLNSKSIESLLKFYTNEYFITFEAERNPSMTTNIHCLMALKSLPKDPEIEIIVGKVYKWLKKLIVSSNFKFEDKWHYSKYYPMSRSIIALEGIDNELTKSIINLMISEQKIDGGWGMDGSSTHEETAYVLLAYCYWIRRTNISLTPVIIQTLEKGKLFLNENKNEFIPLWIGKSLYCPKTIIETLVFASNYAVTKIISNMPYPCSTLPQHMTVDYLLPDFRPKYVIEFNPHCIETNVNQWQEFCIESSLIDIEKHHHLKGVGSWAAVVYPKSDLKRFENLYKVSFLGIAFDNHQESEWGDIKTNLKDCTLVWKQLRKAVMKLTSNEFIDLNDCKPYVLAMYCVFDSVCHHFNETQRKRFNNILLDWIDGCIEEAITLTPNTKRDDSELMKMRMKTVSSAPFIQLIEYANNIFVTESEWNGPDVQKLIELVILIHIHQNDVFSYKKEFKENNGDITAMSYNNIVARIQLDDHVNVQDAINIVIKRNIKYEQEFEELAQTVFNNANTSHDLRQFIDGLRTVIAGSYEGYIMLRNYYIQGQISL